MTSSLHNDVTTYPELIRLHWIHVVLQQHNQDRRKDTEYHNHGYLQVDYWTREEEDEDVGCVVSFVEPEYVRAVREGVLVRC